MAVPGIVQNLQVSQGNNQVYLKWDMQAGAANYSVQRSTDNVNFSTIATPTATNYSDTSVSLGTEYWYRVAAVNVDGTGPYSTSDWAIPAPNGELSKKELILRAQQRADRINSQFVTETEWTAFAQLALYELYDLLITTYTDLFLADPIYLVSDGSTANYDLPNGSNTFLNAQNQTVTPKRFHKVMGVDLGLNTANNAFVTVNKFNFIDRNRFVYPNTASTIYGVFNLQYRVMGDKIHFIPTPSAGQKIGIWFIPVLDQLLKDTDITTIGHTGWLNYVICRMAKYALDKEESDTSKLDQELVFLKQRIEESAQNRDAGMPDRISDVRQNGFWGAGSGGWGWPGPIGGF